MRVYAAFECYLNGPNQDRQLHYLFRNELDAINWCEEKETTDYFWRFYQPIELE